jgi:ABC-type amino acid transport substrate-binding protein
VSHKPITIAGIAFQAPLRFTEGHVLSANEASALNSLLHREVGAKIKTQIEKLRKNGEEINVQAFQNILEDLSASHDFTTRSANSFDPIQREAFKILRPLVLNALKKKNIDIKTLPEGKLEELLVQALAKRPDIYDEAKRRANAIKDFAAASLGVEE